MTRIETVSSEKVSSAINHLVRCRYQASQEILADNLLRGYHRHRDQPGTQLWWACQGGLPVAVAMVLASRGGVGFIYHSPLHGEQTDLHVLPRVIDRAARCGLQAGLSLVQQLIDPDDRLQGQMLKSAGFRETVVLDYMECRLRRVHRRHPQGGWQFTAVGPEQYKLLGSVIEKTYIDSLDCPSLTGRRPIAQVIASHASCGDVPPGWWQLAWHDNTPAGCILLNRLPETAGQAEIIYMGVVPAFRGRSLGLDLLRRAANLACQKRVKVLNLAVDENNYYAMALYETFGFRPRYSRLCMARINPQH